MIIGNIIIGILALFQGGYEENIKYIEDHNSKNYSYEVGINKFINNS